MVRAVLALAACVLWGSCYDPDFPLADCPAAFLGPEVALFSAEMLDPAPGVYTGLMAVRGLDDRRHAVVLRTAESAPIGQALAIAGAVAVGAYYDLEPTGASARSVYFAGAGTVVLSRRCESGLGATLEDISLAEVDPATEQLIAGGCHTSIESFVFDAGEACDPF
jgi:hypothetical protein